MGVVLQAMSNGLLLGSVYGLVGTGLALTFGLWGILNLAHGDFMVIGAYVTMVLMSLGLPLWLAAPVAVVITAITAAVVARGTLHYTRNETVNGFIVSSGLTLVFQNFLAIVFSGSGRDFPIRTLGSLQIGGAVIPVQRIASILFIIVILALAFAFLHYTIPGRNIRAAAQNMRGATLCGVNVDRVEFLSFAWSGALAAVGGVLIGILFMFSPYVGTRYLLKGFIAALLGGLGNLPGTFIAGVVIGVVESVGTTFVSTEWQDAFAYILLYVALIYGARGASRKVAVT